MDLDDASPRLDPMGRDDVLMQLVGQNLDPLSVTELQARIAALEGEIARVRAKVEAAVNHRASADSLFRS